ncbi:MAG: hybrid sensor histidine kinase/response regulator [Aphanothece sp. CMT-3BRIN-NPC111]|nr:hybrid sensor histidine kinase/response regulator [Aphanothece sp. CMT-3BRIN-NPC111]
MIEDEELRNLFKTSCEEHLQNLEAGLLHLEKYPNDQARLQELLREAHTLKGDSRMLGVKDVETLTHQIEHILGTLKETVLSSAISDRLYHGLDAIRKLAHEAVTGEPAGVNSFQILAHLMGANTEAPPQPTNGLEPETVEVVEAAEVSPIAEPTSVPEIEVNQEIVEAIAEITEIINNAPSEPETRPENIDPLHLIPVTLPAAIKPQPNGSNGEHRQTAAASATPEAATNGTSSYRIDTIRVETRNLDALMTQAGELTVTKIRIDRRLTEIEELVNLCEEWSRDTSVNRFMFDFEKTGGRLGRQHNGVSKQIQNFHHRSVERLEKLGVLVNGLRNSASEDVARLEVIGADLEEGIRTLRLLPLSTIFNLFPRLVRDLARQQGKEVNLAIAGGETKADKRILEEMKDPLMHMIRNCIDHGIETPEERERLGKPRVATLRLVGYQSGDSIVIEVGDDGRGLDIEKIKQTALKRGICRQEELEAMTPRQIQSLIFAPGFSTRTMVTEVSGRGVGLDVVRANVERLKGNIELESTPGMGCSFRLQLRTTLTTAHVLIVEVAGTSYALPVEFVQTTHLVLKDEIFAIEGRQTINLGGQPVSVARLADLLELDSAAAASPKDTKNLPCIILKVGEERLGLLVDALLDEQDAILKPQSKLLKRVRNVAGATILGTGEVCMVLNPSDLMKSVSHKRGQVAASVSITPSITVAGAKTKPVVLLAEDSIAIRTQEKRILEGAGYEVVTAVDGLDGFNKLRTRSFDAVVSDVQMPNMDGLTLAARIRQNKEYNELPIILVTSLASDDDKRRGAEAGANAYITKGNFNQGMLVETLRRLV